VIAIIAAYMAGSFMSIQIVVEDTTWKRKTQDGTAQSLNSVYGKPLQSIF
jgi:hypothetical protein